MQETRDLVRSIPIGRRLFVAHLRAKHRRSYLGYLWLVLPALATMGLALLLESRHVFDVETTELPYAIHVLAGIILWQAFAEALSMPLHQLSANQHLITRTRVPHEALVIAGGLEVLLNSAVRLVILAAGLIAYGVSAQATLVLVPFGIVALVVLGLALGIALAPWGLLYGDVERGLLLFTTLWFFLTPVLYPAPDGALWSLNPVTPLLDATRSWLAPEATVTLGFFVVTAVALAGVVGGRSFYRRVQPHVVARLG